MLAFFLKNKTDVTFTETTAAGESDKLRHKIKVYTLLHEDISL